MKKKYLLYLILFVVSLPTAQAQIAIDSFTVNPETIEPGERFTLRLNLENLVDDDIKNILVSVDLTDIPFAPVESSSEQIIEKMREGEEESVTFTLQALASAEAKVYKIPVTISYENTTKESLISVEVNTEASLDILLESSELTVVDEQGKINLKFINTGLTQIKLLQVSIEESPDYEILSPSSVFIGEVDIADFETEEFTIIPKKKNPDLQLTISYKDANNEAFTEKQELELQVYSEEQAKELGLIKESSNMTLILLIIVLVIGAGVWYRRKRKKKNVY
ncbi:MAG: hypothetical protein QT08_C0003G0005 [archaeon GW2011_AR17]|nr:MAG: hypothetical protein QT08_C0003G0005 [archaeon GW2011_AR17]MBS3154677.1 LPXTG cell wall anchor domain-containing protein [Candidatus Woesearchaeota archaeon]HIH14998.1 LPXTG cell wall anchor domain-containing protein [Nanoarchaeota archaeon]HIH58726.1 LPXTG cell wall anchor domain-containing protein [Nanoarchaeota archaeon]HII13640.1 LPXTG cell wall anchor domain-containing protein [Nanoarchaeota archaeon]